MLFWKIRADCTNSISFPLLWSDKACIMLLDTDIYKTK